MTDFNNILQTLLLSPENEVVEFKEAKNSFDVNELGKYFSALSNEANLRGTDFAWLVFGVADKTREIVGTSFKNSEQSLQECIWLDAVQKHKPVTPLAIRHLKAHGLIEGRSPNYTISLSVAQITHQLPHYNKVKGLEKERLFQMIGQFVSSTDKGGNTRGNNGIRVFSVAGNKKRGAEIQAFEQHPEGNEGKKTNYV